MAAPIDTGGPAFPGLNAEFTGISSEGQERFDVQPSGGMTLRDYFATKAMQGFAADPTNHELFDDMDDVAVNAYRMADAMLKARKS